MYVKPEDIGCRVPYCQKAGTRDCNYCPANPTKLLRRLSDEELQEELGRRKEEKKQNKKRCVKKNKRFEPKWEG